MARPLPSGFWSTNCLAIWTPARWFRSWWIRFRVGSFFSLGKGPRQKLFSLYSADRTQSSWDGFHSTRCPWSLRKPKTYFGYISFSKPIISFSIRSAAWCIPSLLCSSTLRHTSIFSSRRPSPKSYPSWLTRSFSFCEKVPMSTFIISLVSFSGLAFYWMPELKIGRPQ